MQVKSQLDRFNDKQTERMLKEQKHRQFGTDNMKSIEEAAYITGEFIARKNNFESTKLEDIVKSVNPDFLKK